jgi:hypothetical protein
MQAVSPPSRVVKISRHMTGVGRLIALMATPQHLSLAPKRLHLFALPKICPHKKQHGWNEGAIPQCRH